ncbi:hypothetical protein BZA05DRAFT_449124 [Tricharina praecox]|uniref:uncharacterized protein n=1 Tax=Tricharina praecox TaxID=43433 RepID=UPI00221F83E2|nr:uncharacterized protein BZA05DRAFT_449124 [Tricharina praecox]KAI5842344.1 hypothetical protein BZA05DRAFT_449124 [Tricharina praecox]
MDNVTSKIVAKVCSGGGDGGNGSDRIVYKLGIQDFDNSDSEMKDGGEDDENTDSGDGAPFVALPLDSDDKKADGSNGDDAKSGDDGDKSDSGDGAASTPSPRSCDDEDSDPEFYEEDKEVHKKDGQAESLATLFETLYVSRKTIQRSVSAAAVVEQQSSALPYSPATGSSKDTDGMESLVALFEKLSMSDERTKKDEVESLVALFKNLSVSGKRGQNAVSAPAPPKRTDGVESFVDRFKKLSVSGKRRQDTASAPGSTPVERPGVVLLAVDEEDGYTTFSSRPTAVRSWNTSPAGSHHRRASVVTPNIDEIIVSLRELDQLEHGMKSWPEDSYGNMDESWTVVKTEGGNYNPGSTDSGKTNHAQTEGSNNSYCKADGSNHIYCKAVDSGETDDANLTDDSYSNTDPAEDENDDTNSEDAYSVADDNDTNKVRKAIQLPINTAGKEEGHGIENVVDSDGQNTADEDSSETGTGEVLVEENENTPEKSGYLADAEDSGLVEQVANLTEGRRIQKIVTWKKKVQ